MSSFNASELENLLTPPGNGVFTVKTAEDIILSVQQKFIKKRTKTKFMNLGKKLKQYFKHNQTNFAWYLKTVERNPSGSKLGTIICHKP